MEQTVKITYSGRSSGVRQMDVRLPHGLSDLANVVDILEEMGFHFLFSDPGGHAWGLPPASKVIYVPEAKPQKHAG